MARLGSAGVSGFLAEPDDPLSLRAALERAIAGQGLDPAAGRARVEREFAVTATAARMAELLEGGV